MLLKPRSHRPKETPLKPLNNWMGWSFLLFLAIAGAWGYQQEQQKAAVAKPKAVFVLGGLEQREAFAARLAQKDSSLEIWVSSGSPEHYVERIFEKAGIERDRLHLDYQAQDTVTNFTSLVDRLESEGIKSVYLITSDNHMRRARIIGKIVFGSRGINIEPIPVPSQGEPEPLSKSVRDGARAVLWLLTGYTGEEWAKELEDDPFLKESFEREQKAEQSKH